MKRVTSHKPAVAWALATIIAPCALHLAGVQIPSTAALLGPVSPVFAFAWRVTR